MRWTVQFDNQPVLVAVKIDNKRPYGMLPPEVQPIKLALAQSPPQSTLYRCLCLAQFAGTGIDGRAGSLRVVHEMSLSFLRVFDGPLCLLRRHLPQPGGDQPHPLRSTCGRPLPHPLRCCAALPPRGQIWGRWDSNRENRIEIEIGLGGHKTRPYRRIELFQPAEIDAGVIYP